MMRKFWILIATLAFLILPGTLSAHENGVTELKEGTIKYLYVSNHFVGAKGYVIGNWADGLVRVEVINFPHSNIGYEVFLFKVDVRKFNSAIFEFGNPVRATVADPPPLDEVAAMFTQWYSIGDIEIDVKGNGTLGYRKGDDLAAKGLNMIMIFEKKTDGRHEVPEDFGRLIVEGNGPLEGSPGSMRHHGNLKVF
jgi:hypothetical protein